MVPPHRRLRVFQTKRAVRRVLLFQAALGSLCLFRRGRFALVRVRQIALLTCAPRSASRSMDFIAILRLRPSRTLCNAPDAINS